MIKNYVKGLLLGASIFIGFEASSQGFISDFENLPLDTNSYWNGSNESGGFTYGLAYFENSYDTTWGSWTGFSYSNMVDITTAGWGNQYSVYTGVGYDTSANFAIANVNQYSPQRIKFVPSQEVQGFYITNTTYTALSMRDGDSFSKIFGADTLPNGSDTNHLGQTITDEDWLKVSIYGMQNDTVNTQFVVDYYLADFRFADDAQDYIVDSWNWVDLASLGEVEGLHFEMSSSDVGSYGMNTPAYFAMDNLTVGNIASKAEEISNLVTIYPNPATDRLNIKVSSKYFTVSIFDNVGRIVKTSNKNNIDIADLNAGMYVVSINVGDVNVIEKLIVK